MKLTRLRLLGFKSFVEPTDFLIEPGLTGVVGPNGCGKSNLVEALRWVMGESSHKNMRATGMDDVIFSGSATRPARVIDLVLHLPISVIDRSTRAKLRDAPRDAIVTVEGRVREHLAPGGAFVFDIFNPSIKLLARAPEERSTVARVTDEELGEIHLETTIDYDAATQVNRGAWHFSAPGRPDFLTVPLHLRSIFPQELPVLLAANGFELEARFGDFGRNAFTSESARQVCVCRSVAR